MGFLTGKRIFSNWSCKQSFYRLRDRKINEEQGAELAFTY